MNKYLIKSLGPGHFFPPYNFQKFIIVELKKAGSFE